jgi:hypothetical protein
MARYKYAKIAPHAPIQYSPQASTCQTWWRPLAVLIALIHHALAPGIDGGLRSVGQM